MIGRLRGTLAVKRVEFVLVDVAGVGYEVHCPLTVIEKLPPEGSPAELWIHTHVREDQITLFGFDGTDTRTLFRLLLAVSGIGPRLALTCLSGLEADVLAKAIVHEDLRKLSSIPGVGRRTAERLVLELREKLAKWSPTASERPPARPAQLDDLDSALRNLGYKAKDVETLIAALAKESAEQSFEGLLREALKRLNG